MNESFPFRIPTKAKTEAEMLSSPSWLNILLKKTVAEFTGNSKKFAKLATDLNICIVLENKRNCKKLFINNLNKLLFCWERLGKHSKQQLVLNRKVRQTCMRRHTQPLANNTKADIYVL